MKEFVKSITSPYEKELIETRRYLHRHPELSFQETDTAAYIRSTLNALGVPLMKGISGTSTVAVIKGEKTGPCIAFRADIDALPVEEENDLPFKSEVPGVMHAFWMNGLKNIPAAVLSRGVAGVIDRTFVMTLPGSRGGVKDGVATLDPLVEHICRQMEDYHDH